MQFVKDFRFKALGVNVLLRLLIESENNIKSSNFIAQVEMFDDLEKRFFGKRK